MFHRQTRTGVLCNHTDNFLQLARWGRWEENPLVVDSFVELHPADEEALERWLQIQFPDRGGSGYLPGICGFQPRERVFSRENIVPRLLADPDHLPRLIAERARVSSAKDWFATVLNPLDGATFSPDGAPRPGLLLGVPRSAIREQQTRLLRHHVRPRRLEIGTLALLGGLHCFLAHTASTQALVVCEIEYTQTRVYVLAKDGVHILAPLPHGLLSIEETAMKELTVPDVATARLELEEPSERLLAHGRRLVRVLSRHLKPAVDHFELQTGHRLDALYCAALPLRLAWLGQMLGAAVDLQLLAPDLNVWLPTVGLQAENGGIPLSPAWLPTLSLVARFDPPP